MRAFTVDVAALALDVDRKSLDNLLSRNGIPGARGRRPAGRQGLSRRLSVDAIVRLAVALTLARELGASLGRALRVADALVDAGGRATAGPVGLSLDLPALEASLTRRLALAVESAREPRRGRPPRRAMER